MDLKQLSYFVKIVEEGSISGAAKKLFMSQPPLSSQMKLLETELDCTLFERGSRTIHLTEAGETLYNYSRSLLQLSNVAKQETMNAARHFNGVLRIGIVSSLIGSDALGWLCGFPSSIPVFIMKLMKRTPTTCFPSLKPMPSTLHSCARRFTRTR